MHRGCACTGPGSPHRGGGRQHVPQLCPGRGGHAPGVRGATAPEGLCVLAGAGRGGAERCPRPRAPRLRHLYFPVPGGSWERPARPSPELSGFLVTSRRATAASREVEEAGDGSRFSAWVSSRGIGNSLWEKATGCESLRGARLAGCGGRGGQRGPWPGPERRQGFLASPVSAPGWGKQQAATPRGAGSVCPSLQG